MWLDGSDERHKDGGVLRRLRNEMGPLGLDRFRFDTKIRTKVEGNCVTILSGPNRGEMIGVHQTATLILEGKIRRVTMAEAIALSAAYLSLVEKKK